MRKLLDIWVSIWLAIICAMWLKDGIEADALTCNRLIAKPAWASILTCQKTYHYQPDPFTG